MLNILLVDDDPEELELISSALNSLNINADLVQAEDCMDLSQNIRKHKPDIVFLDINMPFLSGLECLKSVRSDKRFENLPIIMYSTSHSDVDILQAFQHKANLYVVKPDNFEKLRTSLEKVLSFDWQLGDKREIEKFVIA